MNRIDFSSPPPLAPVTASENRADPQQARQFERVLDSPAPVPAAASVVETDARLKRWLEGAPLATVMAGLERSRQRDVLWQWYRQDLSGQPESRRVELREALMGDVAGRWLVQFAEPQAGPELDRLALKAQLKECAPFGKQQETLLLNVLEEIKGVAGSEYLGGLIRRELQVQIPLNAMIDNLMRNTHKPDLES